MLAIESQKFVLISNLIVRGKPWKQIQLTWAPSEVQLEHLDLVKSAVISIDLFTASSASALSTSHQASVSSNIKWLEAKSQPLPLTSKTSVINLSCERMWLREVQLPKKTWDFNVTKRTFSIKYAGRLGKSVSTFPVHSNKRRAAHEKYSHSSDKDTKLFWHTGLS